MFTNGSWHSLPARRSAGHWSTLILLIRYLNSNMFLTRWVYPMCFLFIPWIIPKLNIRLNGKLSGVSYFTEWLYLFSMLLFFFFIIFMYLNVYWLRRGVPCWSWVSNDTVCRTSMRWCVFSCPAWRRRIPEHWHLNSFLISETSFHSEPRKNSEYMDYLWELYLENFSSSYEN